MIAFLLLLQSAEAIRELDPRVGIETRSISEDVRLRIREANGLETGAWRKIKSREDWERYRDYRIGALRKSLGTFPDPPKDLKVRVTRTLEGDGFRIENLVFESRPGLLVTANLYVPHPVREKMPGLLICHSHHHPKHQGELQDMGMMWARAGCLVLVMDQLGHGERRQHPFVDASSYPKSFRVSRQDYHFRYVVGIQLHLVGESLMGWMAWDLWRGVDLLLGRPGIDPSRIALLGAVAGGGDPCAVAAALDPRIAVAVPFNFGGPQPETRFPLPEDPEEAFNYAGGGSWESTRNLRRSARDGFLPWVIVGAIAPRGLVYAHEFSWDRQRDPVWKRLGAIYGFYGADRLGESHGAGTLTGKGGTHCNNIGEVHRKGIHAAFAKWFGLPVPEEGFRDRRERAELDCLPDGAKPGKVHELARARQRAATTEEWDGLLGGTRPAGTPRPAGQRVETLEGVQVVRLGIEVEKGLRLPLLILEPPRAKAVVVGLSRRGKEAFLKERADAIAELLEAGVAVCLPDLRGTGETAVGKDLGRRSSATGVSSTELMVGRTLLGLRVRDVRSVIEHLRRRKLERVALWGDSFASANPPGTPVRVPLDVDIPRHGEPLGALAAILAGFLEDGVTAVYARGGLTGFASLLADQFVWVSHDLVVPGVLTAGDLDDVVAAMKPCAVRRRGEIDGLNRRVTEDEEPAAAVRWLIEQLRR